ncbi:micronuclear linker histone polyprotein-like [Ptychodera flava]|uniref:micronuclear linker histone polyprotein-like n=1 Tax=Ptychodera flava TaxID=63121 RepID=UPI003969F264
MASRKSKPAKNQKPDSDVADRLREIKQMQANWMSQRERHQESGGSGVFDSTSTGRQEENHKKTPNSTPAKKASTKKEPDPYMWIISSGQKKKKSSVRARSASPAARTSTSSSSSGSRTSSRQNSSRNSTHAKPPTPKSTSSVATSAQKKERASYAESGKQKRQVYSSEPDLNSVDTDSHGLESDSRKHRTNSIDKGAMYNLENSDIRTTSNTASNTQNENISGTREKPLSSTGGLMAPDMFDKLADQIASRVKAEIEQEREQEEYSRPRRVMSHDGGENDDVISSHKCSKCKQLMVPPDHTPTLLIPCGHTMCEACAEDRINARPVEQK